MCDTPAGPDGKASNLAKQSKTLDPAPCPCLIMAMLSSSHRANALAVTRFILTGMTALSTLKTSSNYRPSI